MTNVKQLAPRLTLGALAVLVLVATSGCIVRGQGYYTGTASGAIVYQAPPPPRVVVRPPAPQPGYMWVDGYWSWNGAQYVWVDGYWTAPRAGYVYVQPRWVQQGRGWVWQQGGWQAQGSVGVRPANPGYYGRGSVGVRPANPPPRGGYYGPPVGGGVRGRGTVEVR
jgi:hypothetical protein